VLARGEWSHIRPLDAIVSYPVMRRDGSLLLASGYDAPTRTLAEMTITVDIPDAPSQAQARAALATLFELVGDFPFAGEAQRSAWLAMLLTVLARPAIDGPTPLGLFEATQRGSGKSMLADVISVIATGAEAPRRVAPKTREEWDKVLFSILLAGDPLVLFDNVTHMLVSDALDAVLTGTSYAQRLLGVSEDRRVAIRTVILASANNARLSTDLVRRSLGCRLEPDVERPETRTGFRLPDLLGHAREHRSRYLGAALVVLRAYAVAGRPAVKARPLGSYESWCRVVRDSIVWAGAADPAVTQDALRETADVERDELRDLLSAWHARLGDRAVTVREIVDAVLTPGPPSADLHDALRSIMPNGAEPAPHAIGNRLRMLRGQIIGGMTLRAGHPTREKKATWQVVRV
jgi:putative DNA primase/helicase